MKVLVVGGGGREHALAWKIAQSPRVEEVICAPGNAGISRHARCVPVAAEDVDAQVALAKAEKVGLVVVGPEAPLVDGLTERLQGEGILVFGPSAAAARLEGSKAFAKDFMERHGIPTAKHTVHEDLRSALAEVERRGGKCVVKADGLAAGKGVMVCRTLDESRSAVQRILGEGELGAAGSRVIIEDLLEGEEASVLAICDGERFVMLAPAQDHKAAFEGDAGPNTGGMGAYVPAPIVDDALAEKVRDEVIARSVEGMRKDGHPFCGVLYAGLMIEDGVAKVLEFNVRFGDPECQPLLMMLGEDIVPILESAARGELEQRPLAWREGAAMCVVLVSEGYPGAYEKGKLIEGLDKVAETPDVVVFHAGTKNTDQGVVTSGGRVLGVTAVGADHAEAATRAYEAAGAISFEGMRMRRDIGHRVLG